MGRLCHFHAVIIQQGLIPMLHTFSYCHYTAIYSVTLITTCVYLNCSIDSNHIGDEGGGALGKALAINQTLQELR